MWWNLYQTLTWVRSRDKSVADHATIDTWVGGTVYPPTEPDPDDPEGKRRRKVQVACEKPWGVLDDAIQTGRLLAYRRADDDVSPYLKVHPDAWAAREFRSWRDAAPFPFRFRQSDVIREFPEPVPSLADQRQEDNRVSALIAARMAAGPKMWADSFTKLHEEIAPTMSLKRFKSLCSEAAQLPASKQGGWDLPGRGKKGRN